MNDYLHAEFQRGWNLTFADSLFEAQKKKEKEIDHICFRHYSDFLNSVQDLVQMKTSANILSNQTLRIYTELDSTGRDLIQVLDSLEALQNEKESTAMVLNVMLQSKRISSMMVNLRQLVSTDDLYGALQLIQILQKELNNIVVKQLQQSLQRFLPIQTNYLLGTVNGQLQDMLGSLRFHRLELGETILRRY